MLFCKNSECGAVTVQTSVTPPQGTTPDEPPAEQPTESTSESGARLEGSDPDESGR
jgi:hypothetical protein